MGSESLEAGTCKLPISRSLSARLSVRSGIDRKITRKYARVYRSCSNCLGVATDPADGNGQCSHPGHRA